MTSLIQEGGQLEGFRYATRDEVRGLYNNVSSQEFIKPPTNTQQTSMEQMLSKTGITGGGLGGSIAQIGFIGEHVPGDIHTMYLAFATLDYTNTISELRL